jgi:putative SOS response-associated peptidase YedK
VGLPPPPKVGNQPVTNVRNVSSPFWRAWLKPQYRCLVPLTSFSEYADTKPRKTPIWFALNKDRPLAAFAGIWRPWKGVRGTKADPVEGEHLLYSFLTTEPNSVVKALSTWCRRGKAAAGAAVTRVHVSPREQHQSHRAR